MGPNHSPDRLRINRPSYGPGVSHLPHGDRCSSGAPLGIWLGTLPVSSTKGHVAVRFGVEMARSVRSRIDDLCSARDKTRSPVVHQPLLETTLLFFVIDAQPQLSTLAQSGLTLWSQLVVHCPSVHGFQTTLSLILLGSTSFIEGHQSFRPYPTERWGPL